MDLRGEQQTLLQTTCEEHGCVEPAGGGALTVCYLATHEDWDPHNDDRDGEARYEGDDHRCSEQHAHLPQNLAGLRPWLLAPEGTS